MRFKNFMINVYFFFFIIRRFIVALLVASMKDTGHWGRTIVFLIVAVPSLVIVCVLRPYKDMFMNIILIANEVVTVVMALVFTIFASEGMFA